jgi:hypothetical protein
LCSSGGHSGITGDCETHVASSAGGGGYIRGHRYQGLTTGWHSDGYGRTDRCEICETDGPSTLRRRNCIPGRKSGGGSDVALILHVCGGGQLSGVVGSYCGLSGGAAPVT